jgi:crotonobetainyl-CoA:carnitine CoA-transferase CaiB-like acyl-CoA transferase
MGTNSHANPKPLPLDGVIALDLTEVWAGPMCNSLLGDLGATVIKVESFPRPSLTRLKGLAIGYSDNDPDKPRPWDRSALHNMVNRNKLGVTLNITKPKGMEILKRLVQRADVASESFSAGVAAKLGIDYPSLAKIKLDIIVLHMSGWGTEGPYQGYAALGSALDGFTGHHAMRGYPDTDSSTTPIIQHSDAVGAVTGCFAILAALHHRRRTGKGQWIDMSQVEAFLPHLGGSLMDWNMNRRATHPLGNRHPHLAPWGCYRCAGDDNWLVINVTTEAEWLSLCKAAGNPGWASDPQFADAVSRRKNHDALDTCISEWTRGKDKYEAMKLLQASGVPAQAILDDTDLFTDPHLKARGFFPTLPHAAVGPRRYPGFFWRLTKMDRPVRHPPNLLGEHNDYVYGEMLGMSKKELANLRAEGIIGEEFPPEMYNIA